MSAEKTNKMNHGSATGGHRGKGVNWGAWIVSLFLSVSFYGLFEILDLESALDPARGKMFPHLLPAQLAILTALREYSLRCFLLVLLAGSVLFLKRSISNLVFMICLVVSSGFTICCLFYSLWLMKIYLTRSLA